jgi:hypothetical protein
MKKKAANRMGRPKKPVEKRKGRYLQVRVTDPEKAAFDRASDIAGMDLSVWVRDRLRIVARGEIEKTGEKPAFDLEM